MHCTPKTGEVLYDYDALNRRIRRQVDTDGNGTYDVSERLLYDTNIVDPSFAEVVLIIDELSGQPVEDSVIHRFFNGPVPDMVFSDQTPDQDPGTDSGSETVTGTVNWLLQDRQNTVTDVVHFNIDTDQWSVVNHLEYNSFGELTSQTDDSYQPLQTYTGQILDDVTGLHYYDARWFDSNVNQFLSEDPIGFAAGDTNVRRYVGNGNPNATDPTGHQEKEYTTKPYDWTEVIQDESGAYYWVGYNYQFGFGFGGYFVQEYIHLWWWDAETFEEYEDDFWGPSWKNPVYNHPYQLWTDRGKPRSKEDHTSDPMLFAAVRRRDLAMAQQLVLDMFLHVGKQIACEYGPGVLFGAAKVGGKWFLTRTKAGQAIGSRAVEISQPLIKRVQRMLGNGAEEDAVRYIEHEYNDPDNWVREGCEWVFRPKPFLGEECTVWAKKFCKKHGLSGKDVLHLKPKNRHLGTGRLPNGRNTSYQYHAIVLKDGKVYDELNPTGIDFDEWKRIFREENGYTEAEFWDNFYLNEIPHSQATEKHF